MKYQKTEGFYVYAHITPEKEVYIGISKQQPQKRWNPSNYKRTALEPYIERFGWENIEHLVIQDNLTKEQALKLEDWFITNATKDEFCINKNRSGLIASDVNVYKRKYKTENEEYRERQKTCQKQWYLEHREEHKAYDKQRRASPEGKIYNRVASYNQKHPDKAIETPAEAKRKYLENGVIPSYIKNDDL